MCAAGLLDDRLSGADLPGVQGDRKLVVTEDPRLDEIALSLTRPP
jgi:hypothetical protein